MPATLRHPVQFATPHQLMMVASFIASLGIPLAVGLSFAVAQVAGGEGTTGLITSGGAVAVLGGVLAWILTRTQPELTKSFRDEMTAQRQAHDVQMNATRDAFSKEMAATRDVFSREMAAQREAQDKTNDRLIRWLSQRADLPGYPPDDKAKV